MARAELQPFGKILLVSLLVLMFLFSVSWYRSLPLFDNLILSLYTTVIIFFGLVVLWFLCYFFDRIWLAG